MARSSAMVGAALLLGAGGALFLAAHKVIMKSYLPKLTAPTVPGRIAELARWDAERWRGLTENSPAAAPRLAEYWAAARMTNQPPSVPWSAAWVSWITSMVEPGALPPSAAHMMYSHLAYSGKGKYRALDPKSVSDVREGDILVFNRDGSKHTFESLTRGDKYGVSHGDIVTRVEGDLVTLTGGNKFDSVRSVTEKAGDLKPFVVLRYESPIGVV